MQRLETPCAAHDKQDLEVERGSRQIPLPLFVEKILDSSGIRQEIPPGSKDFRVMSSVNPVEGESKPLRILKYTEPIIRRRRVSGDLPKWHPARIFAFELNFAEEDREQSVQLPDDVAGILLKHPAIRATREVHYPDTIRSAVELDISYGINPFEKLE